MVNLVVLQGRITAAPELKTTQSGISVCSFTLAVDRRYKQENGPSADFINCVAWRNTAEFIAKYFNKGQEIVVEGSLQVRTYDDKQGVKKYITEVQVENANFCGPKQQATEPAEGGNAPYSPDIDYEDIDDDDDLPF